MKKITLYLEDEIVSLAREAAARSGSSLSGYVTGIIREGMAEALEYDRAMRRYLALPLLPVEGEPEPYLSRDEIYRRGGGR